MLFGCTLRVGFGGSLRGELRGQGWRLGGQGNWARGTVHSLCCSLLKTKAKRMRNQWHLALARTAQAHPVDSHTGKRRLSYQLFCWRSVSFILGPTQRKSRLSTAKVARSPGKAIRPTARPTTRPRTRQNIEYACEAPRL